MFLEHRPRNSPPATQDCLPGMSPLHIYITILLFEKAVGGAKRSHQRCWERCCGGAVGALLPWGGGRGVLRHGLWYSVCGAGVVLWCGCEQVFVSLCSRPCCHLSLSGCVCPLRGKATRWACPAVRTLPCSCTCPKGRRAAAAPARAWSAQDLPELWLRTWA